MISQNEDSCGLLSPQIYFLEFSYMCNLFEQLFNEDTYTNITGLPFKNHLQIKGSIF